MNTVYSLIKLIKILGVALCGLCDLCVYFLVGALVRGCVGAFLTDQRTNRPTDQRFKSLYPLCLRISRGGT
jgi:hypothetical protein